MADKYAAFISYAHRDKLWVKVLRDNLELCLAAAGRRDRIFLDTSDLASGSSWLTQLQNDLIQSDHLILVATPEALASPWVDEEWQAFLRRNPGGLKIHIAVLVDTPLPPFLEGRHRVDFQGSGAARYQEALAKLTAGLLGASVSPLPALPQDLTPAPPPTPRLPTALRSKLLDWLEPVLARKAHRRLIAAALRLDRTAWDAYPARSVASVALVRAAEPADDPAGGTLRFLDMLRDELAEELPDEMPALDSLAAELQGIACRAPGSGLLALWLRQIAADHDRPVPYFQQRAELELLDRVYVPLELRPEPHAQVMTGDDPLLRGPLTLSEVLALDPRKHPWVTRRWVVRGDPGSGKTTLLRHLAARLAEDGGPWVPVFASLPRLLAQPESLLAPSARFLAHYGTSAQDLPAILEQEAREGRLLLLLDGLDEIPREQQEDAAGLLCGYASRWPGAPLVVSTRPIGYHRPDSSFRELDLLPLDHERRLAFLAGWFGRTTGAQDMRRAAQALTVLEQPGLAELAGNPLYLTLMALLVEEGALAPEAPPRGRTELYDLVFDFLLKGKHRLHPEPIEHPRAVRSALRHLAGTMTVDDRGAEPLDDLAARMYRPEAESIRAPLESVRRWRGGLGAFFADLAKTGILGPHDGPDSDWRFWHRTFREALTAEGLEEQYRGKGGRAAVLAQARAVTSDEDLSRWAEPFALLAGRVDDPDDLVKALVSENRALGLRALATAERLRIETLREILGCCESWQEKAEIYRRLPELVGEARRALDLIDELRLQTRNGNELYFLDSALRDVMRRFPEHTRDGESLAARFYDHIPRPPEDLFRWIETPRDGRVPLWREIPAGRFWMGSPEGKVYEREKPRHEVTIVSPFRMGVVPVTNAQYAVFDPGHEPAEEELRNHPVGNVTWYEAMSFCRWLSGSISWAHGCRLPVEEEWEYACLAGRQNRYWSGEEEKDLAAVGWYSANSGFRTHRVGEKPANPWGLYDVHGNVFEWTLSAYTGSYEGREGGVTIDPATVASDIGKPGEKAASGGGRVMRGGGCWLDADGARAAYRDFRDPGIVLVSRGFRVLLPAGPEPRP